ncbi:sensor domain-containing protein [Tsukamurella sp. 8F]|uniref:sensor domain-containing protein n=1 Tax=unclassified Tsukamurella TaxID=2633480 RepID=UPI0023B9F1DC|nr:MULTISPECIES: sensor domain-containing protein [unclassified Tsukamurella]MDF0530332.1 sensor domain-containing protein [Tsukamurella sp. 8J]MDF0587629.1 sensor domain-containing protein [Tsukamurella sp. 8F]
MTNGPQWGAQYPEGQYPGGQQYSGGQQYPGGQYSGGQQYPDGQYSGGQQYGQGYQGGEYGQHYGGPQYGAQLYQGGPGGSGGGRKYLALLIGGAVVIVLVVIALVVVFATRGGVRSDSAAESAAAASSSAPNIRVVPSTVMPSAAEVTQLTLQPMTLDGDVYTSVISDAVTTPANCALARSIATTSGWGDAESVATQAYTNGTGDNLQGSAYTAAAVFPTPAAAKTSLTKVSEAVHGCTSYTVVSNGTAFAWSVSDAKDGDDSLAWVVTQTDASSSWKCSKVIEVVGNFVSFAQQCASNPVDGPKRMADLIVQKAKAAK